MGSEGGPIESRDAHAPGTRPGASADTRARGNPFGLGEALVGIAAGFLLSLVGVSVYASLRGGPHVASGYGAEILSLVLLWVGFVGAVIAASRLHGPAGKAGLEPQLAGSGSVRRDFGLSIRPLVDLPLGIAVGVASQLVLVPILELPLRPFVRNLSQQLDHPTHQLFGGVGGAGLVVLSLLVCVGSPVVEELFFRGLWLRALLGRLAPLGGRRGPAVAIVVTALVFSAVHFEELEFIGLAGFGVVLGYLAWRTGRLGPGMVAHMSFNAVTVIYYALHH